MAAIAIEPEIAESRFEENPQRARQHMILERSAAYESMAETRRSVWDLRLPLLEEGDLPGAFEHLLQRQTFGKAIQAEFSLQGSSRRLPPAAERPSRT